LRVTVGVLRRLGAAVAGALAGKRVVEPYAVEEFHQGKIQHVDPHHRRRAVIAVVVPGAVGGEDEIATLRLAALALDDGVAPILGQDGAARIGRMDMHRRHVAGIVDRDGAADRVGDLQPAAKARIGEQELLALRELDRRHVAIACDFGDAVEIGADLAPPPAVRRGLDLVGADPPGRHLAARLDVGVAEPRPLRRRIRLGPQPDVEFAGFGIELFHRLARIDGRRRGFFARERGHGVSSE
jgi:hypothetical protein